jgi:hypothetical protein
VEISEGATVRPRYAGLGGLSGRRPYPTGRPVGLCESGTCPAPLAEIPLPASGAGGGPSFWTPEHRSGPGAAFGREVAATRPSSRAGGRVALASSRKHHAMAVGPPHPVCTLHLRSVPTAQPAWSMRPSRCHRGGFAFGSERPGSGSDPRPVTMSIRRRPYLVATTPTAFAARSRGPVLGMQVLPWRRQNHPPREGRVRSGLLVGSPPQSVPRTAAPTAPGVATKRLVYATGLARER